MSASFILSLALIGVLSVNVMSILRVTNDPQKMVEAAVNLATSDNEKAVNIASSGELLTGQNLLRLIKGLDNGETEYTYGSSFFTELLVFVPKRLL